MAGEQLNLDWDAGGQLAGRASPVPSLRAATLVQALDRLAKRGVYLGTSSWKYPGWLGQVYDQQLYQVRGRFSEKRFNAECLSEYARIFSTVGGDFSFYQFPTVPAWQRIFDQLPDGFRFSLKVPEDITLERFPDLPRYGQRAGADNAHFMDAQLINDELLAPLEPYHSKLGVVIFEFGTIRQGHLRQPANFVRRLDGLLSALPASRFNFAVEVRNGSFLNGGCEYLACLRDHGVAHCFNSWTRMPAVLEQLDLPGVLTAAHVAARFLLKPGRTYEQAVKQFSPYERIQDPYPEGRAGLAELIGRCLSAGQTLFAFVNNRFEGNAVDTIGQVISSLSGE